jgi:hypothetical protein
MFFLFRLMWRYLAIFLPIEVPEKRQQQTSSPCDKAIKGYDIGSAE